jgi:hypothetical protein
MPNDTSTRQPVPSTGAALNLDWHMTSGPTPRCYGVVSQLRVGVWTPTCTEWLLLRQTHPAHSSGHLRRRSTLPQHCIRGKKIIKRGTDGTKLQAGLIPSVCGFVGSVEVDGPHKWSLRRRVYGIREIRAKPVIHLVTERSQIAGGKCFLAVFSREHMRKIQC